MKMMQSRWVMILSLFALSQNAFSATLNGEYSIATQITQLTTDIYSFDYFLTNNNQAVNSNIQPVGLDGFSIVIPDTSIISNVINPTVYTNVWSGPPSSWISSIQTNNNSLSIDWFGIEWNSIYPVGATAHFGFTAENVGVGTTDATLITFWNTNPVGELSPNGAYYTFYATQLVGPVAIAGVPITEPSSILLLGIALAGIGASTVRRCRTKGALANQFT